MTTQADTLSPEEITFSFGRNWHEFVQKHFSEERVAISKDRMLSFLRMANLRGKYFLDIGCGSGLHSLAALRAGADRIVSIDIDPYSILATRKLREHEKSPANWDVRECSILNRQALAGIEPADIVYSWGVLHHTGSMWEAIENAASLIKPGGLFYVALYTKHEKSQYWFELKKKYNRAGPMMKRLMDYRFALRGLLAAIIRGRPSMVFGYSQARGMSYMTDVRDWLGGYPYEFCSAGEMLIFAREKLGLELINIIAGYGAPDNTDYLFQKKLQDN